MTSTAVLLVTVCALITGALAAWFVVPTPVPLEGERWFKTILAFKLADPDRDVWRARVARWAPYHPLGRFPERKVSHPAIETMPGAPLEGEAAFLRTLAAMPSRTDRYVALMDQGADALMVPALSLDHLPRRWLGEGAWTDVVGDGLAEQAEARASLRWVVVTGTPRPGVPDLSDAFGAFATAVDGGIPDGATDLSHAEALAAELRALLPEDDAAMRLVVVGLGDGMTSLLAALRHDIPLRDRVLGVLSVGGIVGGIPDAEGPLAASVREDWMGAHFRHELLDTEIVHRIPYASVQFVDRASDPPGAGGVPVASARFPEPQYVGRESAFIEPVDLGVLPADPALPATEVVGALRLLMDLWVLARR